MSTFHSEAWVTRFIVVYLIVLLVLEPLKAVVHETSMSAVAQQRIHPLVHSMLSRVGYVLGRLSGQLDLDCCGVQHVMTACRVARVFPSLPAARLLLSLRDSDVVSCVRRPPREGCCVPSALQATALGDIVSALLATLHGPVVNTGLQFVFGTAYVLSLLFGSEEGAAIVFVAVILWYMLAEIHFVVSVINIVRLVPKQLSSYMASIAQRFGSSKKYSTVNSKSDGDALDRIRSISSDSFDNREEVEFRNVDSIEIGFFSDRQESIRSDQKSRNDLLLLPQNSFLRNPSIATIGNHSMSRGMSMSSKAHHRGGSMESSVSLQSEHSGQSGPIMLIKTREYSSSEEESSDEDDSPGRGIDHLLTGVPKPPATRSPRKRSGQTPPKGSPSASPNGSLTPKGSSRKSPKKGHYSPALNRLSSLRRSSRRTSSTETGGDDCAADTDMSVIPDTSAVGDIKRNRWLRLKRTWSSGAAATQAAGKSEARSKAYPIPYTILEAIDKDDAVSIDGKNYIYGHKMPKRGSKRTTRVLQGKVLSITSCCFDETGSLWIHHEEDESWFFAFDMVVSKRGAVLGHHVLPALLTVLYTELRSPHMFGSTVSNKQELPSYETLFTFQLLFLKGTAVELRRSFGAISDLNTTLENSLKVLEQRDANSKTEIERPYKFFSVLPVDMEGSLDLYEEGESKLNKFVAKVERWLVELLFFVESEKYEDSNIPAVISNFLAPNNTDVELMTNKIMEILAVATPPPSPSYVKKRPSGMPMFEADLFAEY